ncbi:hypothetical protein Tco_0312969 [Tanacetum coccineum]
MIRRCVQRQEALDILEACHNDLPGFGASRAIIIDRGSTFLNDPSLSKVMLNIESLIVSPPQYLATQTRCGSLKYSNRVKQEVLKMTVDENPCLMGRWNKLDDALWAFRTAYKTPHHGGRMSQIFEASRACGICPSITRASQSSAII